MQLISVERFIANKYSHLLTMLITFLLLLPLFEKEQRETGLRLITLLLLLTIFLCLRVTVSNKKIFWACLSIAAFAYLLDALSTYAGSDQAKNAILILNSIINCIFVASTIIILMKSMFKKPTINLNTILGGVCVYLLIGILWAIFYMLQYKLDPTVIEGGTDSSLFYFSYTTLTTLGYGDIVPKAKFMMMLASFEAIAGQMFLAVFVARLVGLHTAQEIRRKDINSK